MAILSPVNNIDNVNAVVSNFPRQGIVTCELDKSVPQNVVMEDLLLFHSILNLLTHCMGTKDEGM